MILMLLLTRIGHIDSPVSLLSYPKKDSQVRVFKYPASFTNIHFVEKNGRYLMIDAGLPGDQENILKFLEDQKIPVDQIEYLILTHSHPDHAGNAAYFQQNFGTLIIAGYGDLEIIENGGFDQYLCPRGILGFLVGKTIASKRFSPFKPDLLVNDSLDLSEIGWEGSVQTFTSHTKGSLVVFIDQYVFPGDLIKGENLNKQKPAFHIFMCDLAKNMNDLEAVAACNDAYTWFPGHGGPLQEKDIIELIHKKRKRDD